MSAPSVLHQSASTAVKSTRLPQLATAAIGVSLVISVVCASLSASGSIILLCGGALCVVFCLLWRDDEPPILLLPVVFQWSEVSIQAYATTWRGAPLNDVSFHGSDLESAVAYGLLGIIALACGMRFSAGRAGGINLARRLRNEALSWPFDHVAVLSAAAIIAGHVFAVVARFAGGAGQIFLAASSLQYVGLFVFCYWCLIRNEKFLLLFIVVSVEIIFGMTGFFADFKNTILTLFVAALAARPRFRPVDLAVVVIAGFVVLAVATFWTAVKPEYRQLLNQGSGAQEVSVPVGQRLEYLWDRATKIDLRELSEALEALVDRHGYVEFLGLTMAYVPAGRPHENGQLTLNVLMHIAVPRVFYPDKPQLPHDTDVMSLYTGLPNVWDRNTSISIGHLGELYVDFGWMGGLVAMFVIGWLVGLVYRLARDRRGSPALLAAGFCLMAVLPVAYFGTAYIKLMGSFTLTSAVIFVAQALIVPRLMPILLQLVRR